MKNIVYLFTDGSVNPQQKIGYGAILFTTDLNQSLDVLKSLVKLKRFTNTSSSRLEVENLLWGLNLVVGEEYSKIIIYTDSQNILSLLARRNRLENNNYQTKGNKPVKNQQLYQEFFKLIDAFDVEIIKVKGHQSRRLKTVSELVFTLVDKASRKALRSEMKE